MTSQNSLKIIFTKYLLLPTILLFSFLSPAQNLVKDGSFEESDPYLQGDWKVLGKSPDLFTKDLSITGLEVLARKGNLARTGEHYLGLYMGYKSEFIIGSFKTPLKAGKEYYIEIYTQFGVEALRCMGGFREISIWFTDTIPVVPETKWGISINSRYVPLRGKNERLNDPENWEKVTGFYKANGGEQYILLGNFKGANIGLAQECDALYYYFDDLLIEEHNDTLANAIPGQTIELENIQFETDKSELLPISFSSLNQLVSGLQKNTGLNIEIRGHTDNIGNKNANLLLSKNRAKAVMDYLIKQGVAEDRLRFEGFGDTLPIAPNTTKDNRQKNRRVEFIVLSN